MKRYEYRRSVEALCIAALLLSPACSKPTDEALPLSDQEISFHVAESEPMPQSRASLFENGADLTDESKGGGNLTLYAHIASTGTTYISGARAWFLNDPEAQKWIFLNGSGEDMKYYWPNSDALNFFAYMPYHKPAYVTELSYSKADGQTFSCDMSKQQDSYDNTPEFIYAYTGPLSKQNEAVALQFKHPFAAINFKVANGSYRMTIESISFENIHLKGKFSIVKSTWDTTGEAAAVAKFNINKRIPNDVNYNTPLDEDYFLVIPQSLEGLEGLEGVKLRLVAYRDVDNETTPSINQTVDLTGEWVAGQKYVYTISVGDNKSEIYFKVAVEEQGGEKDEWDLGGENNIDVE